jgi:hypothetical protein
MGMFKQRRKHSLIDKLPVNLKDTVEQMMRTSDYTYAEIADFIRSQGHEISVSSIWRYASALNESLQSVSMANENFRVMMEELAKYPQLDTTEGLIRITSHMMLDRISRMSETELSLMKTEDVFKAVMSLTRAAAYKQKTDLANKSVLEAGFEQVKVLVFEAMAKDSPELYKQVSKFLDQKKSETPI